MQKNIERLHKKQRTDAVRGVLLFGVFQLVCVAGFIMLCLIPDLPRWAVILFAASPWPARPLWRRRWRY